MIKAQVNSVLKRTGAPPSTWFLALQYVCYILNRVAAPSLNWRTPLEVLNGETPDISPILQYWFWEDVYYLVGDSQDVSFPSHPPEKTRCFAGFSENVGHAMT